MSCVPAYDRWMTTADDERRARVEIRVREVHDVVSRVRASKYIPWEPTDKQWQFLCDPHFEVLFGGSTGPGKSVALLMDALAYMDLPGYHALVLRRTFPELSGSEGLIQEARNWLGPTDAYPSDGGKRWAFPGGTSLTFGHMETEEDRFKYASSAFSRIYFDELTTFTQVQYTFMPSRIRKARRHGRIPLGLRAATNPIGRGLKWVRGRFYDGPDVTGEHDKEMQKVVRRIYGLPDEATFPVRNFIPALASDNPHLDQDSYELSMALLDPITAARLRHGKWDTAIAGKFFKVDRLVHLNPYDLTYLTAKASHPTLRVRAWDLAATEDGGDWTVGMLVAYDRTTKRYRIEDMVRGQWGPDELEGQILAAAIRDGDEHDGLVRILIEQEPGSSGKIAARDLARRVLAGHEVITRPSSGAKAVRARLPASVVGRGDMDVVMGSWVGDLKDELLTFSENEKEYDHDDIVDALSGAMHELRRLIGTQGTAQVGAVRQFAEAGPLLAKPGEPALRPAARAFVGDLDGQGPRSPFGAGGFNRR